MTFHLLPDAKKKVQRVGCAENFPREGNTGGAYIRDAPAEFFLNDGTVVTAANSREINANLRKAIKTYNNPIELTRIINYP